MPDLDTHRTLVAVKSYLLRHGWQKGKYGGKGGPACLVGAIAEALCVPTSIISTSGPVYEAINDAIGRSDYYCGAYVVEAFNDDPRTTFDDVIATLDRAIIATAPAETRVPEPVA